MAKSEKLLKKAMLNPGGLTYKEFTSLLRQNGWVKNRQKGSHEIWVSPSKAILPIQNKKGEAKKYQVEQFLRLNAGG